MVTDDRAGLQPNVPATVRELSLRFWLALVATGVAAGLGAMAMMAVLRAVQHLAFDYRVGDYVAAVARHGDLWRIVVVGRSAPEQQPVMPGVRHEPAPGTCRPPAIGLGDRA
jgi:hypothetical protein